MTDHALSQPGSELPAPWKAAPAVQSAFAAQVARLEARLKGVLGVAMRHLESGETISVNGGERFPMASTYKVPMAGALLTKIDRGALQLDHMVTVTGRHLAETGPIAQSVRHPGIALSVVNLLELMLTQSNNNATDRILELAGGPASVTAWIRSVGVTDMSVDRSVNDLLNAFFGLDPSLPAGESFLARYNTPEAMETASSMTNAAFDDALEDTSTPDAMCQLLTDLFTGSLLSEASRNLLIEIMGRCETGNGRLRGQLPPGTPVADKTGTIGGTVNDVGMITLPDGRGRLIIAAYTKKSTLMPYSAREFSIAEIARTAFDYFSVRAI